MSSIGHLEDKNQNVRPFSLSEPMYDMSRYTGRLRHFFNVFNPV
jgi:hypothetical protein